MPWGIKCYRHKRFKVTTDSDHNKLVHDSAPIESVWGVLKNELVYHQDYKTRFAAINDIIRYIELYYNEERLAKHILLYEKSTIKTLVSNKLTAKGTN